MIFWSGRGWCIVFIPLLVGFVMEYAIESYMGDDQFFQDTGWPKLVGMLIAGTIVLLLARRWDADPGRTLVDPATGQQVVLKRHDSLMFVAMRYWPYILYALGALLLLDHK